MSGFEIRGRCPGALRPMESGDGWVARIRPRSGRLSAAQLAGIAAAAARRGNGLIDLSSRAHLQLRGVTPQSHPPLIDDLAALGLTDPDAEAEARRNILVTPFWREGDGTLALAGALAETLAKMLAQDPALPGKFGFAVDTGPAPVLGTASADIRLERAGGGGLLLRPEGHPLGARVTAAEAPQAALRLAEWFLASGGASGGRGRMAAHLARGAAPPPGFDTAPAPAAPAPRPGKVAQGWLLALAFGQMRAGTLAELAGTGAGLRLTPWRMLLVETDRPPRAPGLIADPGDPLLRVAACTGAPGCPQALAATRPLARALAPVIPPGALLHVSGCAKGCAHPGPAALTLTARAGGFALIRHSRAGDAPLRSGLSPETLKARPETLFEAP